MDNDHTATTMGQIWRVLVRRKLLTQDDVMESRLGRVLNVFDLTALGVGSTLGVGVYVLAGQVAKESAGPAVILSFLIAAIASIFAGVCYAEFGARVPKAGSAYIYSYVSIGELLAFIIGWNLILEYIIGSASVARGISLYLDTMLDDAIKNAFRDFLPINVNFLSPYIDFLAFGIAIFLAMALAFGMKESTLINNILTTLNILIVLFVIIAGSIKADIKNWKIDKADIPSTENGGDGGFFPFGITGVIKGAATCFYGFIGFDCIASTGEEVRHPQKSIPLSIIFSLGIIFLCYFGVSTVVTLMWPYYLQDPNAPLPYVFDNVGWETAKWIVAIGGLFGLCASLFGAMFPLPRIIYAMANDGLVFRCLGRVNERFKTPVIGTLLAGLITGIMGAIFDLTQLINMMSIGTLLAYTIVAACVLLLRYTENDCCADYQVQEEHAPLLASSSAGESNTPMYTDDRVNRDEYLSSELQSSTTNLIVNENRITGNELFLQIFNSNRLRTPTSVSSLLIKTELFLFCLTALAFDLCVLYGSWEMSEGTIWIVILTAILAAIMIFILISIARQPTSTRTLSFKVPLVPWIPALSILINIYLMLMLDGNTWIRFGVWMLIGLPIYIICISCYKRAENKSTIVLDRRNLNNKMNFAYDNHLSIYVNEEIHPIPEQEITIIHPPLQNGKSNNYENITTEKSFNTETFERRLSALLKNTPISEEKSSISEHDLENSIDSHEINELQKNSQLDDYMTIERMESRISATQAIAILDEVLSHETEESDDMSPIVSIETPKRRHSRKISIDTESMNSVAPPIEHSALVHREDDIGSFHNEVLSDIDETENIPIEEKEVKETEEPIDQNEIVESPENVDTEIKNEVVLTTDLDEELDTLSEPHKYEPRTPATPNVSRAESFLRPNQKDSKLISNKNDADFANKLNILLQEQLLEKPRKKGLIKPINYDSDDETERKHSEEHRPSEASGLLAQIHQEMLARKKIMDDQKIAHDLIKKNESFNENDKTKIDERKDSEIENPTDIRNRLEEIFKTGPQNPEEAQKTLRRRTVAPEFVNNESTNIPTTSTTPDQSTNISTSEDVNNTSTLALQLRARKSLMAAIVNDSGIDSGTSSTDSNDDTVAKASAEVEEEKEEEETVIESPASIRNKLNQILAKGPQLSIQIPRKHYIPRVKSEGTIDGKQELPASPKKELYRPKTESNLGLPPLPVPPLPPTTYTFPSTDNNNKQAVNLNDKPSLTQKALMSHVLKSIELKRKNSDGLQKEGSFLPRLKTQNELRKNSALQKLP